MKQLIIALLSLSILTSCENLDYKKPTTTVAPEQFQEAGVLWKKAKPNDDYAKGEWWKIYNNATLNELIDKLNSNNQNIISAQKSYQSALTLITQARAAYFPTIGGTESVTKQKTENTGNNKTTYTYNKSVALNLSSSWELDVFNQVKYSVNSNIAAAKAAKTNWDFIRLSEQTSLAQSYFELCALDIVQKNLDEIVTANLAAVKYAENRYKHGIDDQLTLISYQNNYQTALQNAQNNHITREQYQHAIAILIGENPSSFVITANYDTKFTPAEIPQILPSQLLERRPDIAQAEYLVVQANAQIGVARSAFFPQLNLATSATWNNPNNLGPLFNLPQFIWSVGPQLSFALFDGGSRKAKAKSVRALYEAQVADYRGTVLSAFGEVEDQLVAVNYLSKQETALESVANNSAKNLALTNNQYKSGIIDNYAVISAKIAYYNSVINFVNVQSLEKSAEIGLIKALGGGWKDIDPKD